MGAAASSLPDVCTLEDFNAFAGDEFDQAAFDEAAVDGKVKKSDLVAFAGAACSPAPPTKLPQKEPPSPATPTPLPLTEDGEDTPHSVPISPHLSNPTTSLSPPLSPLSFRPPFTPGNLYTFGRGSKGSLGHPYRHPGENCAIPRRVEFPHALRGMKCVDMSIGSGQFGGCLAVLEDGTVLAFGSNYKSRLLPNGTPEILEMTVVPGIYNAIQVAVAGSSSLVLLSTGEVLKVSQSGIAQITSLPPSVYIDCDNTNFLSISSTNDLYTWSSSDTEPRKVLDNVANASAGSVYYGAVKIDGSCWTWGYGGHGNLGHGDRKSKRGPERIQTDYFHDLPVVYIACTRGQDGFKGGPNPKTTGNEGPHTNAITENGSLWTWGTAHKGVLLNLSTKTGAFGENLDELRPYRVGSAPRNAPSTPLSPFALNLPYDEGLGFVTHTVSAHIHSACCTASGSAFSWGCGSNDGRCGVERFLNMSGEGKPPKTDAMKCYMMQPHKIGEVRDEYFPKRKGVGMEGKRVMRVMSGRNMMALIVDE